MDAFDLMANVHDKMDGIWRQPLGLGETLDREPGFKTWPELDMQEVERVGRSLAALFGITLDETAIDGEVVTPELEE